MFQGQMQSGPPNPPLEQLSIGQSLAIYYDPEHPEDSVLGDPKPIFKIETISIDSLLLVYLRFSWLCGLGEHRNRAQHSPHNS